MISSHTDQLITEGFFFYLDEAFYVLIYLSLSF